MNYYYIVDIIEDFNHNDYANFQAVCMFFIVNSLIAVQKSMMITMKNMCCVLMLTCFNAYYLDTMNVSLIVEIHEMLS